MRLATFALLLFAVKVCNGGILEVNVLVPEICGEEGAVNVSWVKEMVLLGLRGEEVDKKVSLHISEPKDLCDGSSGLMEFISQAHREQEPVGLVASLSPHLCTMAASLVTKRGKRFVSWTCPKSAGIISLKPNPSFVILAVSQLLKYMNWKTFAFTSSHHDTSPYCSQLSTQIEADVRSRDDGESIYIFGKYEDMTLPQYSSVMDDIQGVFLCISYEHGLSHKKHIEFPSSHPLVLLPEWPLPLELVGSGRRRELPPLLALLPHPQPYNFKLEQEAKEEIKSAWDNLAEFVPVEPQTNDDNYGDGVAIRQRILEPLIARLILQSIKVSVDEHEERANLIRETKYSPQFRFILLKYEKDRWHPLLNLGSGSGPSILSRQGEIRQKTKEDSSVLSGVFITTGWLQFVLGLFVFIAFLAAAAWAAVYGRAKYRSHLYHVANTNGSCGNLSDALPTHSHHTREKKLVPRGRSQGAYKLLLTSRDICFGNTNPGPAPHNLMDGGIQVSSPSFEAPQPSCGPQPRSPFSRNGSTTREENEGQEASPSGPNSNPPPTDKPDLIKGSTPLKKRMSIAAMKNDSILLTENLARYKGDLVHLRKLNESSSSSRGEFDIKGKAINVLETIHGLRHENLVGLIGVLTEGLPAMVWEFCSRGSLHDVLKERDIKLDWPFKLSLLTDLVRGMKYLHSSLVRVHGFLTSYNCVIDARWVLKITDYGVLSFNHNQAIPLTPRTNKELLWTAPELLRDEGLRKHGTQPGDVYSFAIIMQEVLVRGEPYCMLTLTPEEILEKVKRPPPLIRPSVSKGAAPPEAINIMRQCWAEIPDMRPDFIVIHDLFKTLNHGRKANIVDTMFEMLEKYSNNLEELIRERTEQLDLEKKKTEQLLNRMLPSTVAEKLKVGLPVDPEEFGDVTIYFSDIVGFTTISAYSTPFEVVDLLNDLYTCFDATINDYNVYKVETIGDAYMVVGGAPILSPDHADQIATMALDLLHQSGKFRIRHLPYTPLRLRIGIHTGPCCAGVVGLTMPRYCLFGDTVNTASRMESTGAAWRIHISSSTKSKLEVIGGYKIEYRGVTDIKGKGKMPTYWLLGKEGFNKELPKPPSLSESHGLNEKSIIFGRTGVPPSEQGRSFSRHNSQDASPASISASLRCLSPAEEVAHQLLNGRPAFRGLRRQFSLDQGSSSSAGATPLIATQQHLSLGGKVPYRKTPSLEETTTIVESHSHPLNFSLEVPITPTTTSSASSSPSPLKKSVTVEVNDGSSELGKTVTVSPRSGRICIRSSSLTIVEESHESPTTEVIE